MDFLSGVVLFCVLFALLGGLIWGYLEKNSEAAELKNNRAHGISVTERREGSDDPTIPFD